MSTSLRLTFVSAALLALAIAGCSKEKEEPVVLALPSASVAPVKAMPDPVPAQGEGSAAGSAAADPAAAPPVAPPPAETAHAAAPQPIDGCCSALTAMTKDAKLDAGTKSKAAAAAGMCGAMAPLVKSGKGSRSTALTQIKATMAGKAPAACN